MNKGLLGMALLLSIGFNLGLLLSRRPEPEPARLLETVDAGRAEGDPRPSVGDFDELLAELELLPDERRQFLAIHRRFFRHTRQSQARLKALRLEIEAELIRPQPREQRLQEMVREMVQTSLSVEQALIRTTLRGRQLLGPQREGPYLEHLERRLERSRPPRRPSKAPWGRKDAPFDPAARGR